MIMKKKAERRERRRRSGARERAISAESVSAGDSRNYESAKAVSFLPVTSRFGRELRREIFDVRILRNVKIVVPRMQRFCALPTIYVLKKDWKNKMCQYRKFQL